MSIKLKIDDNEVDAEPEDTILEAADRAGIYIPRLCGRPGLSASHDLKPGENGIYFNKEHIVTDSNEHFEGCRLCVVEIEGQPGDHTSCATAVSDGMVIRSSTPELRSKRQENLVKILKDHPHVCLTCAQKEGCSRTSCSANVPDNEKCCVKLGNCEVEKISDHIGISPETPKYVPKGLPVDEDEALFVRDFNYCIGCLRCVRACTDLSGADVLGFVYRDGKAVVGTHKAESYSDSDCRFCGLCIEVCPTGAMLDKNPQAGERSSWLIPCKSTCPAGIDVPHYIDLIVQNKPAEACAVIREKVPFPGVLGRICFHPCESVCRRSELNEPIAICSLKRYAADNDKALWKEGQTVDQATGKNVSIIGSGPAGLTAGYYLARKGHGVTIYEAEDRLGGMLAWGIPSYRLPDNILDQEIEEILSVGIEAKKGIKVGKDISFEDLKKQSNAVYIAVGAGASRKFELPGSALEGVLWGIDFLKDISLGKDVTIGKKVVVIGGGNVAVDVAMTALREGAELVQLACLESREEMPAFEWELKEALEEAVELNTSWGPAQIIGEEGKVAGIELKRCTSVFDPDGKFAPTFDENETNRLDADTVILAIGQNSELDFIPQGSNINVQAGMIKVNEDNFEAAAGIYAGGDAVIQPGSVIDSIAAGRTAAEAIDEYLGGDGNIDEVLMTHEDSIRPDKPTEGFAGKTRMEPEILDLTSRICYDELCLGLNKSSAVDEAGRCLRCNLRLMMPEVVLPPEDFLAFNSENISSLPDNLEGVFQLLDEEKNILVIQGCADIKAELEDRLESVEKTKYFKYEEDPMYSKRESEEIQVYLQKHGQMPPGDGGGDDDDDLF